MKATRCRALSLAGVCAALWPALSWAAKQTTPDPRLRTVLFVQDSVVQVPVQRGQITQIVLTPDEELIGQPVAGQGASCAEPSHSWCVAVQAGDIFVKPKAGAEPTNLIVSTTKRRHLFMLTPVTPPGRALLRLTVAPPPAAPAPAPNPSAAHTPVLAQLDPRELIELRLRVKPSVRNDAYSVATAEASEDIVPELVFDDGARTYFKFPNNRPIPTLFQTGADGSEEMVNVRMDADDLLVADRVARRFVLRLGRSVASITNEAFDIDGVPPADGTAVPGVARVIKQLSTPAARP